MLANRRRWHAKSVLSLGPNGCEGSRGQGSLDLRLCRQSQHKSCKRLSDTLFGRDSGLALRQLARPWFAMILTCRQMETGGLCFCPEDAVADGLCIEEGFGETAAFRDMFVIGRLGRFVSCRGPKPTRVTARATSGTNSASIITGYVGPTGHHAARWRSGPVRCDASAAGWNCERNANCRAAKPTAGAESNRAPTSAGQRRLGKVRGGCQGRGQQRGSGKVGGRCQSRGLQG